jgi:hypothetical protein
MFLTLLGAAQSSIGLILAAPRVRRAHELLNVLDASRRSSRTAELLGITQEWQNVLDAFSVRPTPRLTASLLTIGVGKAQELRTVLDASRHSSTSIDCILLAAEP